MAPPINPASKRQLAIAKKASDAAAGIVRSRGRPRIPGGHADMRSQKVDHINEIRTLLQTISHPVLTVSKDSKLATKAVEWINNQLTNKNTKIATFENIAGTLRDLQHEEIAPRKQGKGTTRNLTKALFQHRVKNFENPLGGYNIEMTAHHVRVVNNPEERRRISEEAKNALSEEDRLMHLLAARTKIDKRKENKRFGRIIKDIKDSIKIVDKRKGATFKFLSAKASNHPWRTSDLAKVVSEILSRSKRFTPTTSAQFVIKAFIEKQIFLDKWTTVASYPRWVSLNNGSKQIFIKPPFELDAIKEQIDECAADYVAKFENVESDGHSIRYVIHEIALDTWIQGQTNAGGCLSGHKDKVAMYGKYKCRSFRSTNNTCLIAALIHATDK